MFSLDPGSYWFLKWQIHVPLHMTMDFIGNNMKTHFRAASLLYYVTCIFKQED